MAIVVLSTFLEQRYDPTLHYPGVYITDTCTSGDKQVLIALNKGTFSKTHQLIFVKITIDIKVQLFDIGLVPEPSIAQLPCNAAIVAVIPL